MRARAFWLIGLFVHGMAWFAALPAQAQAWPSKPITLIVPFGAGGSIDVMGRHFAQAMGKELGQTMIVENRAGAAGNIGAAAVARATPDGHTLLFSSTAPLATNKLMYKSMPFDPDKDLAPIILVGKVPIILAAKKGGRFADVKALAEFARANPNQVNLAVPGVGTLGHLVGLLIGKNLGVSFNIVQYNTSATIINDLLGGRVDIALDTAGAYVPLVDDGQIAALALTSARRFAALPNAPTLAEAAGLPGFEAVGWYALLAPAGTPPAVLDRLNTLANAYLGSEEGRALYRRLGVEPSGGTIAEIGAFIASETEKIRPIVREAGISF